MSKYKKGQEVIIDFKNGTIMTYFIFSVNYEKNITIYNKPSIMKFYEENIIALATPLSKVLYL